MSVSIRLAKIGKRNAPAYRVVVTQTKTKRNGKFIDIIGNYNPSDPSADFTIDKKKFDEWAAKGAIVSDAVAKLIKGEYTYEKYEPKAKKSADTAAEATPKEKEEAPVETPEEPQAEEAQPEQTEQTEQPEETDEKAE
jgi:small subunit ribosomal protein S16